MMCCASSLNTKGKSLEFNERAKFIEEFFNTHCKPIMATKGAEYSRGEIDCNSNFKRVADATGADALTVCYVYLAKHLDSIASFIKTRETKSDETIESRIGDAINYLFILASLIEEQKKPGTATEEAAKLTHIIEPEICPGHRAGIHNWLRLDDQTMMCRGCSAQKYSDAYG